MLELRSSSTVVRFARRAGLSLVLLLTAGIGQSLAADLRVPTDYAHIQAAIDAAAPGDTVLVADGVYSGVGNTFINFAGKEIEVRSEGGPAKCIIDGEGVAPGFLFVSGETSEAVVDGFTVRHGQYYTDDSGIPVLGGVSIVGSSPTIRNCVFKSNTSTAGGAVQAVEATATFTNCTFIDNTSVQGGAVYSVWSDLTFRNCSFKGNSAYQGGALFLFESSATVVNGVLLNNRADGTGGAIFAADSILSVTHGTLKGNVSGDGVGVAAYGSVSMFVNSILWDNGATQIDGYAQVSYSLVQDGYPGNGNVSADPLFTAADDFRLRPGSPAVDAGTASAPLLPTTDLDGNLRDETPDIGAYELPKVPEVPEVPEAPDTTAPEFSDVVVTPNVLTSPDHTMRDVQVLYAVTDDCDSAPVYSVSVVSNEPDNGLGDADTANDIEVVNAHHVRLRAERSGKGMGRIYTITITATDAAGNTATKSMTVRVLKGSK